MRMVFYNPNHDARGRFASGGHAGKINGVFQKLSAKAKGGQLGDNPAYHLGKELKAHATEAGQAYDSGQMSSEEYAHIDKHVKAATGLSLHSLANNNHMQNMHALKAGFKPGSGIPEYKSPSSSSSTQTPEPPKAGSSFGKHQSAINQTLSKLSSKTKNGQLTDNPAYHVGKELKQNAKEALADASLSKEELDHLDSEVQKATGMNLADLAGKNHMQTMNGLKSGFKPGSKVGDLPSPSQQPKSTTPIAPPTQSSTPAPGSGGGGPISIHARNHVDKLNEVTADHGDPNSTELPIVAGIHLKSLAADVQLDSHLSADEKAKLGEAFKKATGMSVDDIVKSSAKDVGQSFKKTLNGKPPSPVNISPSPSPSVPKVDDGAFKKHQDAFNTELKYLGWKSNFNGAVSDGAAYAAGKKLKDLAHKAEVDQSMTPDQVAHLSKELEHATGMTLSQLSYSTYAGIGKSVAANFSKGKKVADFGSPSTQPGPSGSSSSPFPTHVTPGSSGTHEERVKALDSTMQNLYKSGTTNADYEAAAKELIALAKKVDHDTAISPIDKQKLNNLFGVHTNMNASYIATSQPSNVAYALKTHSVAGVKLKAAQWVKDLSSEEIYAIKHYTDGGYSSINNGLRKGDPPNWAAQQLDAAFKKAPPSPGRTVLRAMSGGSFMGGSGQSLVGKTYEDPGFVSTTTAKDHVFSGPIRLTIQIPPGKPELIISAMSHYKHESELLLPRGSKFKILSATPSYGGGWHYTMEYLGATSIPGSLSTPTTTTEPPNHGDSGGAVISKNREYRYTWKPGDLILVS